MKKKFARRSRCFEARREPVLLASGLRRRSFPVHLFVASCLPLLLHPFLCFFLTVEGIERTAARWFFSFVSFLVCWETRPVGCFFHVGGTVTLVLPRLLLPRDHVFLRSLLVSCASCRRARARAWLARVVDVRRRDEDEDDATWNVNVAKGKAPSNRPIKTSLSNGK